MKRIAIIIVESEYPAQVRRNNFRVVNKGSDPCIDKNFVNRHAQEYIAENFRNVATKIFNAFVNQPYLVEMTLTGLKFAECRISRRVEIFQLSIGRSEYRFK